MKGKTAEPVSMLGSLVSGAVLGETARRLYNAAKGIPGGLHRMGMKISKSPGNIEALRTYSDDILTAGGKKLSRAEREVGLDRAIESTVEAINRGEADMYTLAGLLREKEMLARPATAGEDIIEALGRLRREHPMATGVAGGVGATGAVIGLNKLRNGGE